MDAKVERQQAPQAANDEQSLILHRDPPAWQDALATGLAVHSQFILTGNVRDACVVDTGDDTVFVALEDAVLHVLEAHGFEGLLLFDPVDGLRLHGRADEALRRDLGEAGIALDGDPGAGQGLEQIVRQVTTMSGPPVALMIDYASHLLFGDAREQERFLIHIDKIARGPAPRGTAGAPPRNPILWVMDRPGDLPGWFVIGNHTLRQVVVDLPDLEDRFAYATHVAGRFHDFPGFDRRETRTAVEKFALQTEGMTLNDMAAVAELARFQKLGIDRSDDAVRSFRTGIRRNPWTSPLLRERLKRGRDVLARRVKGQDRAIDRTLDILVRSVMGLSGSQSSSRLNRPRGVLFFAGPTGVGKTELAKSVTELLFGDETMMHRFDMTEFNSDRSIARLVGAPPGYAGHELGGELTNAVRNRPFSVILFDEIEKAHPRVLDMFLQILDEGRLTDSRGETAFFSESVIIFTSNVGMFGKDQSTNMGMEILPSDSFDSLEAKMLAGVRKHFRYELRRPELMNRIGQNIVVFDFVHVRSAEIIFEAILGRVIDTVRLEHDIDVFITDEAYQELAELCLSDLFDGGRGIGNQIEMHFINPLASVLFEMRPRHAVTVEAVERNESGTQLLCREGA